MTTLPDRPATALLIVDMQKGVVADAHDRDAVIARIADLVVRARKAGTPVVWVQQGLAELEPGSEPWEIVDELVVDPQDPVVHKNHGDSFEATDLEQVLAAQGVGRLVVAGAQTDACIRSTIHGAFTRGYDVTLVSDAHTTEDLTAYGGAPPDRVISHTNLYWSWQTAPGRTASVDPSADVALTSP